MSRMEISLRIIEVFEVCHKGVYSDVAHFVFPTLCLVNDSPVLFGVLTLEVMEIIVETFVIGFTGFLSLPFYKAHIPPKNEFALGAQIDIDNMKCTCPTRKSCVGDPTPPIFHWKWASRWLPNANEIYTKEMKCTWPTQEICVT